MDDEFRPETRLRVRGVEVYKSLLNTRQQQDLVEVLRGVVARAPLFHPVTARGKKMSVRMTSAGQFGWISDDQGYRYDECHPNGTPWPPIPDIIGRIWDHVAPQARDPECCLINFYGQDARMGMHQDRDEGDFSQPIVSISLGDDALFRIGNETRGGVTESLWLTSGDVVVMGRDARLLFHGVDRVKFGSSRLLPSAGRINVTLRVVTPEPQS